ncbi:MAG: glyoxalase/bleomycin resistance/dioxygenase family protein [Firmicutes bacterium]|nr:glyoxalase/bleomycin resistance/dioxygenase family protein [Bacillota bacterium]
MRYVCSLVTVEDMDRARRFYERVLGQEVKHDYGEDIVFRGDFAIHLRSHFSRLIDGKPVTPGGNGFELYFEHDDLGALVDRLKENGVELVHELREQPWRQRVVRFYDPDKNIIEVGESMEHLSFRLAQEGKPIEEISRITCMPAELVRESIQRYKDGIE